MSYPNRKKSQKEFFDFGTASSPAYGRSERLMNSRSLRHVRSARIASMSSHRTAIPISQCISASLGGQRPVNGFEMSGTSGCRSVIFIRGDADHMSCSKPNCAEIVIAESGACLAVLPDFDVISELSVSRCSHRRQNSLFVIAGIDRDRTTLECSACRKQCNSADHQGSYSHSAPSRESSL